MSGVLYFLSTGWKSKFQKQPLFHSLASLCQLATNVHWGWWEDSKRRKTLTRPSNAHQWSRKQDVTWIVYWYIMRDVWYNEGICWLSAEVETEKKKKKSLVDMIHLVALSKITEHCHSQVFASAINSSFEGTFSQRVIMKKGLNPFLA